MMRFSFVILSAFLFIIILTDSSYALRLNEIESNPEGEDAGFEWVELYSEDTVSLDGHYLDHNSSGGPINLSGSFQGFFVINFPTQWLRNTNEVVYLKHNSEVIDTAGPFTDNKKEKTYSFCNGEWIFATTTNNAENACSTGSGSGSNQNGQNSNNEEEEPETRERQNRENQINNSQNSIASLSTPSVSSAPSKRIVLGKTTGNGDLNTEITKTYKTRIGVIYFFMGLCVLIVLLIAMRKL